MRYCYWLLLLVLACTSCDTSVTPFIKIDLDHSLDLYGIDALDGYVYVVGGDLWSTGLVHKFDPSLEIAATTTFNKGLLDINCDAQECILGGVDGRIYSSMDQYQLQRYEEWGIHRGGVKEPDGTMTFVGGKSYRVGHIITVSPDRDNRNVDTLDFELRDICAIGDSRFAVGFGVVLESKQGGPWRPLDIEGDFFIGAEVGNTEAIILGQNGTLLVTTSQTLASKGVFWQEAPSLRGQFASIKYHAGYFVIAETNGTIRYKQDGDEVWSKLLLDLPSEVNDAVIVDDVLWVVGESGLFAKVLL